MNELISIIVPIYNVENYVVKCIKSIIDQSYNNLEIILVDDGSTDMSSEICDKFASADSRVKVIHTSNFGLVHARKEGLKVARGNFIGFVDGDDYIDDDCYELLLNKMNEQDCDFVQMGIVYEDENGRQNILVQKEQSYDMDGKQIDVLCEGLLGKRQKLDLMVCSLCVRLFKTDLIKECYLKVPDYLTYGEDMACICQYIMRSSKFAIIEKAGYHYVQRATSLVHIKDINFIINNCKLYEYISQLFVNMPDYERVRLLMEQNIIRDIAGVWENITGKYIANYEFPDISILLGKRIIIYGAGKVGTDYYKQICKYQMCNIVALADTYYQNYDYDYAQVVGLEKIKELQWDILIISTVYKETADQIKDILIQEGIEKQNIYWYKPKCIYTVG